jgi:hypothetical protein
MGSDMDPTSDVAGSAEPLALVGDTGALPLNWTPDHVAQRLVEAFATLDRMPRVKGPRAPGGHWPRHKVEWADQLAQAELPESERRERADLRNRALLRPTGADISRMEAALEWLRDLRTADSGLALVTSLWALRAARNRSVRALCREKGWAPATFYKLRAKALEQVAAGLNAKGAAVF